MTEKTDHDKLTEIHAVLLGVNGNPGLCESVARNTKSINKLWIAVVVIAVSVGGGTYGLIQALL
jgi:hypothetical protein